MYLYVYWNLVTKLAKGSNFFLHSFECLSAANSFFFFLLMPLLQSCSSLKLIVGFPNFYIST